MCIYIYIPFSPFLVTTDHASKRVTREFRSAIEMRAEGKKRAKGKKKKRGRGDETISRGQASSSSFCGDGTVFSRNTRVKEAGAIK